MNGVNHGGGYAVVFDIDPETICRCTGIKDVTGKLIYENDIITISKLTDHELNPILLKVTFEAGMANGWVGERIGYGTKYDAFDDDEIKIIVSNE